MKIFRYVVAIFIVVLLYLIWAAIGFPVLLAATKAPVIAIGFAVLGFISSVFFIRKWSRRVL